MKQKMGAFMGNQGNLFKFFFVSDASCKDTPEDRDGKKNELDSLS